MKKMLAVLLVFLVLLMAFGCAPADKENGDATVPSSSESVPVNTEGDELEEISLRISGHPAPHSIPNMVGIALNTYKDKYNLKVENTYYISGLAQQEAAPSNTWETGICGIPPTINGALNYGVSIVGFSIYDDAPQYMFVREDSPIYLAGKGHFPDTPDLYGTIETWKGSTILLPKGTTAHVLTLATLDAMGLTEDDVKIVHMEVPAAAQAFRAGEGDVVCQWSTFTFSALEEGWKPVSTAAAVNLNLPSPIIVTSDTLKNRPDAVQRYVNAVVDALMYIGDEDNWDQVGDIYYNVCIDEGVAISEEAVKWSMEVHHIPTLEHLEELLEVDESGLNGYQRTVETVMDFLIRAGSYDESQKQQVLDAIDVSFMEKAIQAYKGE